ncbi:unnamed protein product [Rotaria sp. Silwood1]|nr:unnamed protein product [Rotaria sp. Silwood1]CAF3902877.1 unnamed protein product [Rotaria sp. Silwood1]CAF3970840.1 unnamed protein product [Rotaria sp. Silwood1]CAF4944431.1 unnamed protein product [Rotaria sp. Silwood1]CAF4966853.1 unnamed protein product [Rotaria sp. Silwood1]
MKISNQALVYAADYHYSSFKLECEPKLNDKKQGVKMVNELMKYIKNDFLCAYPLFTKPLLVDLWWIDLEGNLQMIIKTTELYIYLCNKDRYPNELFNFKIKPSPPAHLPPQHVVILKWVKNSIVDNDIREELNMIYKSIHSISTMNGTLNDRTRHVKIELLDKTEYELILINKKISLMGQMFVVDEFLPAPKILTCGKCNKPEHTKRICQNSTFDICRRCGGDRSNAEAHNDCQIKCHHCGGQHISTDYKCPLMEKFRRELINELKKHPEKLPHHIQLFIPTEYRNKEDKTKYIQNTSSYQQKEQNLNINNQSIWPSLTYTSQDMNNPTNINLRESVRLLNNELQEMKKKYENDSQKLKDKYKEHLDTLNQIWLIMHQQHQTSQQILNVINNNMKQVIFVTCLKTTKTIYEALNKIKTNNNDYNEAIQQLENQIEYLQEAESFFTTNINSLQQLVDKQNEILNKALDSLFKDPNV